jgi:ferredoxin
MTEREELRMSGRGAVRLGIDRIACRGHGLCAGLLPEAVTLDDWGYPVLSRVDLPATERRAARRAAAACPTLALRLSTSEEPA